MREYPRRTGGGRLRPTLWSRYRGAARRPLAALVHGADRATALAGVIDGWRRFNPTLLFGDERGRGGIELGIELAAGGGLAGQEAFGMKFEFADAVAKLDRRTVA